MVYIEKYNTNMSDFKRYNFDIKEMINSFSFENLTKNDDSAAVLFFTDNQYITSFTEDYGNGLHFCTLARIYQDIHGGGEIPKNYNDLDSIDVIYDNLKNYFTANIYFVDNEITFYFNRLDNINKYNVNSFLKFYEDISYIFNKYNILVGFYDKYNIKVFNTNNFDEIIRYLKEHIDNDYIKNDDEEIILGVPTNLKEKKR